MTCLSTGFFPRSLVLSVEAVPKHWSGCTAIMSTKSSLSIRCSTFSDFQQRSTSIITGIAYHSSSSKFRFSNGDIHPLVLQPSQPRGCQLLHFGVFSRYQNVTLRRSLPCDDGSSSTNWSLRHKTWILGGCSLGACVCFSSSEPCNADTDKSVTSSSHGKSVYRDYSITGIPGDGRCLFRSVVHGASIRTGNPIPDEALQRKLADELRNQVADEFIKRRAETEWFIEGDFETYVSQMRKHHVWGGEPELLMASHVLRMPITVYMHDKDSGGLIEIAEYGLEYGKDNPIRVLYHGCGHYDALHILGSKDVRSRL